MIVTGVQVLFAFLLIAPFNSGFSRIGGFERAVYFVTLLLAALAAVGTIGLSAQYRFLFRYSDKRHVVFAANRMVMAGVSFLALVMCGSLLLVATKLFGVAVGVSMGVVAAFPFAIVWFSHHSDADASSRLLADGSDSQEPLAHGDRILDRLRAQASGISDGQWQLSGSLV